MFFGSGRHLSGIGYLQTVPFNTIHLFFADTTLHNEIFLINIIGNILIFLPFGWLGLAVKIFNRFIPLTLFFICCISFIELMQFVTGLGVADIDDVFLNTIGMLIGFLTYRLTVKMNIANIKSYFDTK